MRVNKRDAMGGRHRSGLLYGFTTGAFCITAAATAWFLSSAVPYTLRDIDPAVVPVTAPASQVTATYAMDATLTVSYSPVLPLIVPPQSGTITSVNFATGDVLGNNTPLYSINDRLVTAYAGEGTFYRELKKGDLGEDVTQAQILLDSILPNQSVWIDGDFGSNTEDAVKAWEKESGVAEPTGVFSPEWFIRLPVAPYAVSEVKMQEGQPALAAGEKFATGLSQPTSAVVKPAQENEAPLGAYEFVFQGKSVPVSHSEEGWIISEITLAAATTSRPSEGNSTSVEGNLHLTEASVSTGIPASSIITDGDSTCVGVRVSNKDDFDIVAVDLVEGSPDGSVLVNSTISVGEEVLLNPIEILEDPRCP